MNYNSAIESLHEALASAVHRDLPDIEYERRIYEKWDSKKFATTKAMPIHTTEIAKRRPDRSEVEVIMFNEMWGSTALGYGGMCGSAMTNAYTVLCQCGNVLCVYFGGGRLGYRIDISKFNHEQNNFWNECLSNRNMPDVSEALNKFVGDIE